MPARTTPKQKDKFFRLKEQGYNTAQAAREAGISRGTADAWLRDMPNNAGSYYLRQSKLARQIQPVPYEDLDPQAKRAHDDFAYFRRRYFGRISSPWQEEAGQKAVEQLGTNAREFTVINCPPGAGKTTMLHDLAAWATVRNRRLRGLWGSRTSRQATISLGRLKRSFERTHPVKAQPELLAAGRAFDAEATLIGDFGLFESAYGERWSTEQFVVAQLDDVAIDEKEPTWSAFGMDSGSLGYRVDFIIWDDLVDKATTRTAEAIEIQRNWWDEEGETRLEPGGALFLVGQRMRSDDLYRYCLDKKDGVDDDEEVTDAKSKYHHIVYRAHDESRCTDQHKRAVAKNWPDGCLLDVDRLPWKDLRGHMLNRNDRYRVLYQQEDVDPAAVLVPKIWIDGGKGIDGVDYPGCLDKDRNICQLPKNLAGELISVATADPSPTKYWAIEWWVYHPASEQRFLMDLIKQSMDAPDFLDYDMNNGVFTGIMEEWQQRSADLGVPITHWVVEANAAQRFILQYDYVQRWQARSGVNIIPHQTHRNKTDPEFGVQTIAQHYRFGRVRLPARQLAGDTAKITSLKLIDEVTRYPDTSSDDCVMAQWFFEWNLPNIYLPSADVPTRRTPSWLHHPIAAA